MSFFLIVYVAGVCAYWLRVLIVISSNLMRRMSTLDRNYAAIGMQRNLWTGIIEDKTSGSKWRHTGGIVGVVTLSAFSWIGLAIDLVYDVRKGLRAIFDRPPLALKELQWTLNNARMLPEDVVRFDLLMQESILRRRLTADEIANIQDDLNARSVFVNVRMALGRDSLSDGEAGIGTV